MPKAVSTLFDIDGIEGEAVALLHSVFVVRVEDLAKSDPAQLYSRLYQSNKELDLFRTMPPIETVETWVEDAREITRTGDHTPIEDEETGHDRAASHPAPILVAEPIADAPNAQWLLLFEQAREAAVLHNPAIASIVCNEDDGGSAPSVSVSVPPRLAKTGTMLPSIAGGARPQARSTSRLPHRENGDDQRPVAAALAMEIQKSEELPRSTRRGLEVLHPGTIVAGAVIALITRLLVWAMIIGTPVVLVYFEQYLLYFAAVPALLLVLTLLYAIVAPKVRCRVCSAHLLVSQNCHKHPKAHHLFGFGYVGSLSLHALIWGWFRCQYCGTAMRLR